MGKRVLAAILAVVFAVALIGCGDSDADSGDSGNETSSTSKDPLSGKKETREFVREADAICSKGQEKVEDEFNAYLKKNNLKEIGEGGESPSEAEDLEAEVIETIALPGLITQIDELQELEAPSGEEEKLEAYFDAAEEGIEKGEEDPQLLFGSAEKVFGRSDKLAQELGFKVCGNR